MDADEAARYNKHRDTIKAQEMQKQEITKFENGIKDGVQYTNQQKGNYAEMKMDQYYDSIGFERISQDRVTGLNDAGHQVYIRIKEQTSTLWVKLNIILVN